MRCSFDLRFGFALAILLVSCGFRPKPEPADLVLHNGVFITLDPAHPEAQALAARGQRIVAVGSDEQIKRFIGPKTRVIDLKGYVLVWT